MHPVHPTTPRLRRALVDISRAMYVDTHPLTELRLLELGAGLRPEDVATPPGDGAAWRQVRVGSRWGGRDQYIWLHAEATIPREWLGEVEHGDRRAVLRLLLGTGTEFGWPEGLLYVNGKVLQGINRHHPDVLLRPDDVATGHLELDVRAWSGMLPRDHRIRHANIALLDRPTEELAHLLTAGADLLDALPASNAVIPALANALDSAYDRLDLRQPRSPGFYASARETLAFLKERLAQLRQDFTQPGRPVVTAIGHGHLDVAWLWQTRHTREKTARTFGIATALMDAYPDYRFLHTTPQVFAWLREDYPEMYERVAERVREGRFEAAGAMWVESDCNLVSGESLVRQIAYGQRFLREQFGREYDALWLPDAFGYSAALPQIMLRSGIPLFMTTKLSWSEINRIPADTMRWRGLDGSTVVAHFITTPTIGGRPTLENMDTYNGVLSLPAVLGLWERYRGKTFNNEVLLAFGHGDGGAGPARQYLEQAHAIQQLPGIPELRLGRADEYFARLLHRVEGRADVPLWDGELYLEYHRGTYTSQAWLKKAHRDSEGLLLTAEWLDAWAWALSAAREPDHRAMLDDAWRTLLLHEFHDILPGSSIAPVYEDARVAFDQLDETLRARIDASLRAIAAGGGDTRGALVLVNPSPLPQAGVRELPGDPGNAMTMRAADGGETPLATQRAENGATLVDVPCLAGRGAALVIAGTNARAHQAQPHADEEARGGDGWLENNCFRLELDGAGAIESLVDKRVPGGRELVMPGDALNALVAYEDIPRDFDAWDIDAYYLRKPYAVEPGTVTLVEAGPLRATLLVVRRFLDSTITQRISIYRSVPRVDFRTEIEWCEQQVLLKAAFPLDLRVRAARAEIQYGSIERPATRNTSWEQAQFEVPAHRWLDVSEANYGVSLLNDGRYGHDIHESTVRLTLLRSATYPDPKADQGTHRFTYSLYPHLGDWRAGGTVAAAYALNRPFIFAPGTTEQAQPQPALLSCETDGVVIEAIKRASDGDDLIVRLYEAHGGRAKPQVTSARVLKSVVECDLLERPLKPDVSPAYPLWAQSAYASHDVPNVGDRGWSFELRPFEVRTFRVRL